MNIKRRLYLYFFLLFLTGTTILALFYYSTHRTFDFFSEIRDYPEIEPDGVLNVAIGYNSIDMRVESDSLIGFQYELVKEMARLTPIEVNIVPISSLEECYENLKNNQIDVIAHAIPIIQSKTDEYLFSQPVTQNKIVLIQRKPPYNSGIEVIRNLIDLGGKKIVIPANSNILNRLKNLSYEIADTIHIIESEQYGIEQLIIQVAAGEIDFTASPSDFANQMSGKLKEIDVETPLGFTQINGWMMRKESPVLRDSINKWLGELTTNGVLNRLQTKHFNQ